MSGISAWILGETGFGGVFGRGRRGATPLSSPLIRVTGRSLIGFCGFSIRFSENLTRNSENPRSKTVKTWVLDLQSRNPSTKTHVFEAQNPKPTGFRLGFWQNPVRNSENPAGDGDEASPCPVVVPVTVASRFRSAAADPARSSLFGLDVPVPVPGLFPALP